MKINKIFIALTILYTAITSILIFGIYGMLDESLKRKEMTESKIITIKYLGAEVVEKAIPIYSLILKDNLRGDLTGAFNLFLGFGSGVTKGELTQKEYYFFYTKKNGLFYRSMEPETTPLLESNQQPAIVDVIRKDCYLKAYIVGTRYSLHKSYDDKIIKHYLRVPKNTLISRMGELK